MSGPLSKLEGIVHSALVARGMSDNEARVTISKLKSSGSFKQAADIEISSDGRLVAISPAICVAATPKALNVEWRGQSYWMPKNQIDSSSEIQNLNDSGILVMTKWIAEKKGFISNGQPVSP